jgi:hypothetical protein
LFYFERWALAVYIFRVRLPNFAGVETFIAPDYFLVTDARKSKRPWLDRVDWKWWNGT